MWLWLLFLFWDSIAIGLLFMKIQVILDSPWLANLWPQVNYDWHQRGEPYERNICFLSDIFNWQSCPSFSSLLCIQFFYPLIILPMAIYMDFFTFQSLILYLLCVSPLVKQTNKKPNFFGRAYLEASNISLIIPSIFEEKTVG